MPKGNQALSLKAALAAMRLHTPRRLLGTFQSHSRATFLDTAPATWLKVRHHISSCATGTKCKINSPPACSIETGLSDFKVTHKNLAWGTAMP